MGEDRVNQSPIAPPSFVVEFPLADRLKNLLAFAVVTGRLTDQEADLIQAAVTRTRERDDLGAEAC
jgi:hypothetical protein